MNLRSFQITFTKLNDKRTYRAMVEIVSQTDRIIKLKVKSGLKEMDMEKYLFRKGDTWKVTRINFKIEGSTRTNEALTKSIQEAIDQKLKSRSSSPGSNP